MSGARPVVDFGGVTEIGFDTLVMASGSSLDKSWAWLRANDTHHLALITHKALKTHLFRPKRGIITKILTTPSIATAQAVAVNCKVPKHRERM